MKSVREKIIVVFAVLSVVLYGVYRLWGDAAEIPMPKSKPTASAQLDAFVSRMNQDVKEGELSISDHYILRRESKKWHDIFHRTEPKPPEVAQNVVILPEYSGYLKIGERYFAVIGGDEYEAGDFLQNGLFEIVEISPVNVVLESAESGRHVIPLAERD